MPSDHDLPPLPLNPRRRGVQSRAAGGSRPPEARPRVLANREALARDEDRGRSRMTEVLRELRQLEKDSRRTEPTDEQAARLRELRSEQSRLHAEMGRLRQELISGQWAPDNDGSQ